MDAAIPADAQNAPTGIWKSRTEREIPTAPTPIIVVVNERKHNGDSNSVAKPSTESDQAQDASLEEVLHLIQNGGYGKVYRDLEPGIGSGYNLLHDAMDVARGGRFKSPPATYPAGAWNTYDDASCDYACGDVPCAVEIQRRLGSRLRDHR